MEAYLQSNKSSEKLSLTLLQGCDTGSMNWVYVLRHSAVPERWSWGPPIELARYHPLIDRGRTSQLYQRKPDIQGKGCQAKGTLQVF